MGRINRFSVQELLAGLIVVAGTAAADAQSCLNWVERHSSSSPSARDVHQMVYDGARNVALLFGGELSSGSYLGDTWAWAWDGNNWTWTQVAITGPSSRVTHSMAYNSDDTYSYLFGGQSSSDNGDDMWRWDGSTWSSVTIAGSRPPARGNATMVYDDARNRLVLYGGRWPDSFGTYLSDTWEWDGSSWTQVCSDCAPGTRAIHAMAFDKLRGVTVLFGGVDPSTGPYFDTWEWDGTTWTQKSVTGPSVYAYSSLVFDSNRQVCVLFGGVAAGGVTTSKSWEWDGIAWREIVTPNSPPARHAQAMAYDGARNVAVLFGGSSGVFYNDTWELSGTIQCPTVSQWGLVAMGGLVLLAGGVVIKRRRAA